MLHIKLKGMEHRTPCKYISCYFLHPQAGSKGEYFFSKSSYVAYQIKGNGAYSTMQTCTKTYTLLICELDKNVTK